ncbi:MAG TPA: CinA family protein [Microlunatus sp.]|nr:CinA family protein [Microlunatus sp.]
MSTPSPHTRRRADGRPGTFDVQKVIITVLKDLGLTVATAESLTGGNISAELSALPGAGEWFAGAVVAYAERVKYDLLGVDPGPVITARAARQMALGAARLLGADFAVATTGVGGPGRQEGLPEGTVFIAISSPGDCSVVNYHFDGQPADVVARSTRRALENLAGAVARHAEASARTADHRGRRRTRLTEALVDGYRRDPTPDPPVSAGSPPR